MPSIAAHFVVAKLVSNNLDNINKKEFYKGAIYPDIIDGNSHYYINGKYYQVPYIKKYIESNDLKQDINKGYLCHLLTDKYFLDEYVIENIKNYDKINIFTSELMYNDYTNMNYLLLNRYKLDIDFINSVLSDFKENINKKKLLFNKNFINSKNIDELLLIDYEKFCLFLEKISIAIVDELKRC